MAAFRVAMILLFVAGMAVVALPSARPEPVPPGDEPPQPVLGADLPVDVTLPTVPGGGPVDGEKSVPFFDDFSWRSFIALSWPARVGSRGEPDRARTIKDRATPVVWETWKTMDDLFSAPGGVPAPWDDPSAVPAWARSAKVSSSEKFLSKYTKLGEVNQAGFGTDVGPLVAQNRSYVRYEVRINKDEYEFIRGDGTSEHPGYYLKSNLPKPSPTGGLEFPAGSIGVKAAWREVRLPEERADLGNYYCVDAEIYNPKTGAPELRKVALIGLHIVRKTASRPQWVWSSFEHVLNVPGAGVAAGARLSLNTGGDPPPGDKAPNCDPVTGDIPAPIDPQQLAQAPRPVQVTRVRPIHPSTAKTNDAYRALLKGSVWENYQLVMTQFPTDPAAPLSGKPYPAEVQKVSIANTTMETFYQNVSCLTCHKGAGAKYGVKFVYFLGRRALGTSPASARYADRALSPEADDPIREAIRQGASNPQQ